MNTNKVSRGLVSKLQRTLLTALVVMVMFGSLPVDKAHAASGSSYSSIKCGTKSFNTNLVIKGAFDGQWVKYRLIMVNGYGSTTYTNWSPSFRVYGMPKIWFTTPYAVTRNLLISVVPEILYWNGTSWERPAPKIGPHYEAWADSIPNSTPYCTILA